MIGKKVLFNNDKLQLFNQTGIILDKILISNFEKYYDNSSKSHNQLISITAYLVELDNGKIITILPKQINKLIKIKDESNKKELANS